MDADGDYVVEEIDVFSAQRHAPGSGETLSLFQFPHWPKTRPLFQSRSSVDGPAPALVGPPRASAKPRSMRVRLAFPLSPPPDVWDMAQATHTGHGSREQVRGSQLAAAAAASANSNPQNQAQPQQQSQLHSQQQSLSTAGDLEYVMSSQRVPARVGYCVGVFRDLPPSAQGEFDEEMLGNGENGETRRKPLRRELHLTPLTRVLQFRPDLSFIDDEETARRVAGGRRMLGEESVLEDEGHAELVEQGPPADSKVSISAQFKRRDRGGGAAARGRGGVAGAGAGRGRGVGGAGGETNTAAMDLLGGGSSLHRIESEEAWKPFSVVPPPPSPRESRSASYGAPEEWEALFTTTMSPATVRTDIGTTYGTELFPIERALGDVGADASDASQLLTAADFSVRVLQALPTAEEQVRMLCRHAKVINFAAARSLCSATKGDDELLVSELTHAAVLVRDRWVCKSVLLHKDPHMVAARDFLMLCLQLDGFVLRANFIRDTLLGPDAALQLLDEICTAVDYVPPNSGGIKTKRWVLKRDVDPVFVQQFQDLVKTFGEFWAANADAVVANLRRVAGPKAASALLSPDNRGVGIIAPRPAAAVDETDIDAAASTSSQSERKPASPVVLRFAFSGSNATEQIASFLDALFAEHGVCNLEFIRQCFKELQRRENKANIVTHATDAMLKDQLNIVGAQLHGAYYRKASDANVKVLRDIVLAQFANSVSLKRQDIMAAAKEVLGDTVVVSNSIYMQVMKELSKSTGGAWVFKSGEGR